MRPEGNPLDLNNLPEDHHGKLPVEESSTTTAASTDTIRFKKKKSGGKDDGKVYECRFCSLKFCKSQALGGHMNRHRQERETETLNRARQLVFGNEVLATPGAHMGYRDFGMGPTQVFQHRGGGGTTGVDPCLQFRPVYPRLPTQTSGLQPCVYPSSSSHPLQFPSSYPPPPPPHPPTREYFAGHVLSSSTSRPMNQQEFGQLESNYACFGAPVSTHGIPLEGGMPPMVREGGSSGASSVDHFAE